MQKKNIVIFGATSRIAQEVAKCFAKDGHNLFLIGRNEEYLETIKEDLRIRFNIAVDYLAVDLNILSEHERLLKQTISALGSIDIALIAYGTLSSQKKCELNFAEVNSELQTNLISPLSLLTLLANYFEARKQGCISVISSVAGERGRQSNYVYGTAKAGLNAFLQGLRQRLSPANVNVLTIKPGFVDTPMTKEFKKSLLWAQADTVAASIVKAIYQNRKVLYTPWFWQYIMFIIRGIPEFIFCKLKL